MPRDEVDRKADIMSAQWLVGGSLIGLIVAPIFINDTTREKDTNGQMVTKPVYNYTAIFFTVLFALAFIASLLKAKNAYKPVV
jgi:hypothetical protein